MGRRPLGNHKKEKLNLTISEENKLKLIALSNESGKSISKLIEEYAEKEFKKKFKRTELKDFSEQITFDELEKESQDKR